MRTHRVVKINEITDGCLQFIQCMIKVVGNLLSLHDAEECLCYCIIVWRTRIGKGLGYAMLSEMHPKRIGGILQALVTVKSQTIRHPAIFICFLKCSQNKSGIVVD